MGRIPLSETQKGIAFKSRHGRIWYFIPEYLPCYEQYKNGNYRSCTFKEFKDMFPVELNVITMRSERINKYDHNTPRY